MTEQNQPRSIHTVTIVNLGCAKNQVDAEYLIRLLKDAGYLYTGDQSRADAIIVNSCGFIQPAKEESISVTMELKARYPKKKIVLAGCLAQRYAETMALAEADGMAGNRDLSAVIDVLRGLERGDHPVLVPDGASREIKRDQLLSPPATAYVKIAEGCDNRCSYCAIPLIRGPVVSRRIEDILYEISALLDRGIFELNLVAQDLASFGRDRGEQELPELLRRISGLSGDFWVRLLYIHPDRFPEEILPIMKADPRILPYFDIPFQHASTDILRRMGRRGTAEEYLKLVARVRSSLPQAVFRTTILLGFPGETDRQRREVQEFLKAGRFLWAGFFVYSPEEDTPAARYAGTLKARWSRYRAAVWKPRLEALQSGISREVLAGFIGHPMRLLVDEPVQGEDLAIARGYIHAPEVDGAAVLHGEGLSAGDLVDVQITACNGIDLEALPVLR
ncbi:30S ribosomal protein S12 methylthiotransferase RimO [Marispirochaeta sp.]|jgi:ribosomal protein S12 methylthiotransferase|uniref:30S ribosomal protein S12 methylthiotransferase RimO n=1 Tax=Marispirochaeta sp. TaxID=2038653 RepID=UPI0029C78C54|nr:30S ribosomal protein S12 methylthiotransferase RimO [Marispirochaeta sp.]